MENKACYTRLTYLRLLLLFVFPVVSSNAQIQPKKYNVLFIAVDDLNTDLSSYGHPLVKTPNFERLAKRGVQFNRAYCQYPLCNPTRASLLTGRKPDQIRVYDLKTNFRDSFPDIVTLPQLFKTNGYHTVRIGKIYHYGVPGQIGTDGLDDPVSWNKVINPKGRDVADQSQIVRLMPVDLGASLSYLGAEGEDEEQTDGIGATEAIRILQSRASDPDPFFLALGFYRPHTPFVAPKKYFDMYPLDKIKLPEATPGDLDNIPSAALWTKPANWGLSETDRKKAIRAYYASTTFMDAQLGRVLDALDSLQLNDNTIIVLWSDHGFNLGEHGQWQKRSLFEKCVRVPLVISMPGAVQGATSQRTVELLDIYPTLAEVCGLQAPESLAGQSLKSLLLNPKATWTKPAFSQVALDDPRGRSITLAMGYKPDSEGADMRLTGAMGRSIRTERWRYTEWDHGKLGYELYDEKNDPDELTNLAENRKYKKQVRRLSRQLKTNFKE